MVIGRIGYACAQAVPDTVGSAAVLAAKRKNVRRGSFMPPSQIMWTNEGGVDRATPQVQLFSEGSPADGMRAAAQKKGLRHAPVDSSIIRLLQVSSRAKEGNVVSLPGPVQ
jgi:hypothetical protein